MAGYPKKEMAPGKIGIVTDLLMNKNIGIDGKVYQLLDARVDRVKQDNPQIGDEVEYKISASKELTEKGKISFFAIKKRATTTGQPPAQPTNLPDKPQAAAPAKREPRIIQGQYLSKTGSSITLKDGKGNAEAWPADLDLITFLNKADAKVKPMDMVKVRLLDNHGEWIAKDMGPFDPSIPETPFKTAQEPLKENLDSKKAEQEKADAALAQMTEEEQSNSLMNACKSLPEKCDFIGCAIPGNMPLCLKEWVAGSSYHPICVHSSSGAGRVEKPVIKPVETITDTEHADLIARGEAAKMAKIQKEAAEHAEKMKAENAARKASEAPKETPTTPITKTTEKSLQNAPMSLPDDVLPATGGVELAIHVNLGNYSSFDLKVTGINGEHARQLLQQEAAPTIALAKSIIKQASSGY